MPPKKQKEKALTLDDFNQLAGASGSWADNEADFSPAFQTVSTPMASGDSSSFGGWASGGGSGDSRGFSTGGFTTAPAAIPNQPPFTARVGNVSYDVNESHLQDFFATTHQLNVESLRLPRGPDGQVKGAAYVDFADRESLVQAIKLGGSQILGRTVSVSVAEQRGPAGFGGPRLGMPDFDWSARSGPLGGSAGGSGDDRLSRFRPRSERLDEPEIDWSQRGSPLAAGHGAGGMRAPRAPEPEMDWSARSGPLGGSGPSGRTPRAPEPEIDWSQRSGPVAARSSAPRAHRAPEPEVDWSARSGPIAARPAAPRAPRAPEPEIDWSARSGPMAPRSNRRAPSGPRGPRADEPQLDWSARGNAGNANAFRNNSNSSHSASSRRDQGGAAAAPSATVSPTGAAAPPSAAEKKKASEAERISKLKQGFMALQLDDEEAEKTASAPKKTQAPEAGSISDIQEAQREASKGSWSEAK